MTRTIGPATPPRGLAVASRPEPIELRSLDPDLPAQREEKDTGVWSFEQSFEQACCDVQAIFRARHEVNGLLLFGLENGLFIATPFVWESEAERALLYDRLSSRYQGQAEFYIHATELSGGGVWGNGAGTASRIVRVFGMNRELTVLTRCWRIQLDPVPRLVEQEDVPCPAESLSGVLFDRFRSSDIPGRER